MQRAHNLRMAAYPDFWLHVYELESSLRREGNTREQRQAAVLKAFDALPATTRPSILDAFSFVADELHGIADAMAERATVFPEQKPRNLVVSGQRRFNLPDK